jgi:hypothetical protein
MRGVTQTKYACYFLLSVSDFLVSLLRVYFIPLRSKFKLAVMEYSSIKFRFDVLRNIIRLGASLSGDGITKPRIGVDDVENKNEKESDTMGWST